MSNASSNPGERLRGLRPWFLVAAMVLTWLAGVQGTMTGCQTVSHVRDGTLPDRSEAVERAQAAPDTATGIQILQETNVRRANIEGSKTSLPLGIARVLLSLLLVVASATMLAGRRGSRSLGLQAIAANAAFAIAAYVIGQPVREAWIQGVVQDAQLLDMTRGPPDAIREAMETLRTHDGWYGYARLGLAAELFVLAIAGLAVLSRRTRAFMDAVARAEERLEREDEP